MVNLKSRIENLQKETGSMAVKSLCEKAIKELNEINNYVEINQLIENNVVKANELKNVVNLDEVNMAYSNKTESENNIVKKLIDNIKTLKENDDSAKRFIDRESRFYYVNNLGVRNAISEISECDLSTDPALRYIVESFKKRIHLPEYILAEEFVSGLSKFEWHPVVKESLKSIREHANLYKEDFMIHKAVYNIKNSRSSYILSGINESIAEYLINRTKTSKAKLLEKLNRFMFDPSVRELTNVIRESEATSLNVQSGSTSARANKIYSPIILTKESEIFGIDGEFYEKKGNVVRRLSESEQNQIDPNVVTISKFISSRDVKVIENEITIYSNNKKVILTKEGETVTVDINGKKVSHQDFNKIFTNAAVFRPYELKIMENINLLIENFDSIVEVEFAKRIQSTLIENRRIDVIRLAENIFVNKFDPSMGKREFFKNLNATQTKTLVNEFLNYDLSESFTDMIPNEEAEIKAIEETKKAYIQTIADLEEKMQDLSAIKDKDVLESEEFQSIVNVIKEEIEGLKAEYNDYVAIVHNKTQITAANEEEMGTAASIEPSVEFRVDDRVTCSDDCEGTVIGLEDGGNNIIVLCDNGTTRNCTTADIKKSELANEDHAALGVPTEASTSAFTADDKVELKDGRYGTVQGVNDTNGKVTVLMNDGKTCECMPSELVIVKEKGIDEDHAALGVPTETSPSAFTADDKVEYTDGRYGTVQGVNDTTGKITVVFDDGETCECNPEELIIVKEKGVDESESVGDKVKLKADGRNATIQGSSEADNTLTVLTDDGETLVVSVEEVEIIDDLSGKAKEEIEGQQSPGNSVTVVE
jgi:hypothetical protein